MSLSKLPVLLFMLSTCRRLTTSPTPVPEKQELVSSTTLDWIANRRIILQTRQAGQILLVFAEILSILATTFPSHSLSKFVLYTLVFKTHNGDLTRIHTTPLSVLAALLFILGTVMRLRTYDLLGRFFTFQISIKPDHQLITTGPYSYVRHPSYTGLILADLGWVLYTFGRGSWVCESGLWDMIEAKALFGIFAVLFISAPALVLSRMKNEDRALKEKFGKEWEEWAKRVPYSVLTGVY